MQYSLFDASAQAKWPAGSFLVMDASGVRLAEPKEILGRAADLASQPKVQREFFTSSRAVAALFAVRLHESLEHEVFAMALVDSQHQLIEYAEPFRGTLNQAMVYPREIVKQALRANAAGVFVGHNHPSGLLEASRSDLELTKQLQQALALVDIRLLDHILVAGGQTLSFAEHGLM